MDSVLYDDLVTLQEELHQLESRLKAGGAWGLYHRSAAFRNFLIGYLRVFEEDHRHDPQVQLSMLAHIEGRKHDYTGDAA